VALYLTIIAAAYQLWHYHLDTMFKASDWHFRHSL